MNSFLYKLNPFTLVIYFVTILFGFCAFCNPILLFIALFCGVFLSFIINAITLKRLFTYIAVAFIIAATNPIFSHNGETPLFFINGNAFTLEATLYGAYLGAVIISTIIWLTIISCFFDEEKIVYIIGRKFPKLAFLISLSMRFIPKLKSDFCQCENAQKSIGLYTSDSLPNRIRSKLNVLLSVAANGAESAIITSRSMKSRGWGSKGRTFFSTFKISKIDVIVIVISLIFFLSQLVLLIISEIDIEFYPSITNIPSNLYAIIIYISYSLYSICPAAYIILEKIKWKYYLLKI